MTKRLEDMSISSLGLARLFMITQADLNQFPRNDGGQSDTRYIQWVYKQVEERKASIKIE